ncbi:MAG: hypothetical protein AAGA58_03480 [Verrucomicrobiota bacterium]
MLLIARYDCFVNGQQTGTADYQVRYFECLSDHDAKARLRDEPPHEYLNELGELVHWKFVEILAIEQDPVFRDGDEIIGFITTTQNDFPSFQSIKSAKPPENDNGDK